MSDESDLILLADAIVAAWAAAVQAAYELGEQAFAAEFTAEARLLPAVELEDLPADEDARVYVIPAASAESRVGGGASPVCTADLSVDVVVQKKLGDGDIDSQGRPLLLLAQQLRDALKPLALSVGGRRAVLASIEADPAYGHATLFQTRCFASAATLTFRMAR